MPSSPVPLCCPARASLLTGQYPHNHGVQSNKSASGGGFDGLDQTNTLARWLHDAGYRTSHIGKYMNGYNQGKAIPIGWDEWWATSQRPFLMYDYTLNHNGAERSFGFAPADYKTDVLTRLATDFVRTSAPQAQPFYLQLWYTAPHVEEGTDSTGQSYNDQPPRPAPRHRGLYSNAPFPTAPSFNEADVSGQAGVGAGAAEARHVQDSHHGRQVPHPAGLARFGRRGHPPGGGHGYGQWRARQHHLRVR